MGKWTITAGDTVDGAPIAYGSAVMDITARSGQRVIVNLDFYTETDFDTDGIPGTHEYVEDAFTVRTAACAAIAGGGNNKNYIINVPEAVSGVTGVSGSYSFPGVTGLRVVISGGGVYVGGGGAFTLNGGTISGNTAADYGGGVYLHDSPTSSFSKSGGTIYGDNNTVNGDNSNGPNENTAKGGLTGNGHAAYMTSLYNQYRDGDAGPGVDLRNDTTVNWGL